MQIVKSSRQKAFISIFLSSLLIGGVAAVTKIGLLEIPPLSFSFLRFFLASLFLIPFTSITKKSLTKELAGLIPLSLLATANIILFVLGIKVTTATIGQMLYAGVPLLTGLIAHFFLNESLAAKKFFGIILGFLGVGSIVFLPVFEPGERFSGNLQGNILIGVGVICWSFYMAFSKKAQKRYSPLTITSMFILVTMILLFPLSLLELRSNYGWWKTISLTGLLAIIYVSIFATAGFYLLNQYAIKHGGSVFASMAFYLTPIFAFLTAFVLLGERLTRGFLLGSILASLGIFFTTKK